MIKENTESKKWALGLLIGSAIGAGTLYYVYLAQSQKKPLLKRVGKTIVELGEMLEHCQTGILGDAVDSIEKKLPSGMDVLNHLADWVDVGTTLWRKWKKR